MTLQDPADGEAVLVEKYTALNKEIEARFRDMEL